MKTVKIGIIGCGNISHRYIQDIQRLYQDIVIEAVASRHIETAQRVAALYNVPKVCTVEQLLADPDIEIVVNLTPPTAHTEINMKILNAGKHLFTEKPFALTVEECQMVSALAREKGLKVGVAPETIMSSNLSTCKKLLKDNWIGRPLYVTVNMMSSGVETWHPAPENFYLSGGGPVYDMGGYYFTAIVDMLGPVKKVYAVSGKGFSERTIYTKERFGTRIPVETPTHYSAILTLKSGVIVNANFSFDIWKSSLPLFEVYGTDGTMEVPDPNMHGGVPKIYRKEQKLAASFGGVDTGEGEAFAIPELSQNIGTYVRCLGLKDLVHAIAEDCRPRANSDLATHVVDIMTGIMKSAESGNVYELTTTYEEESSYDH